MRCLNRIFIISQLKIIGKLLILCYTISTYITYKLCLRKKVFNLSYNDFDNNEVVHRSRRNRKQLERSLGLEELAESPTPEEPKKKNKKHKPKRKGSKFKTFIKICLTLGLLCAIVVIGYIAMVISKAPEIETGNIESLLAQSSTLYDDKGKVIDNVFSKSNRTLVEISKIPEHTQKAFIALEDKTFESHHGFNIIRIFGAMKEALTNGGHLGGTSTITQQLARNLYLTDRMQERSINRKIIEAYYSVILENKLTKDQILEAYLNTVSFGSVNGIQTAAQAYFSKDVSELTIAESATLAAIPQLPSVFALVMSVPAEQVSDDDEKLIVKNGDYAYMWNDKCHNRMLTCLKLMYDQGYISEAEYEEAKATNIKDLVHPTIDALNTVSNYFADYVLVSVIKDFQDQYGWSYEKAADMVYNRGVKIYTTMDSQSQSVVEKEYANDANFPQPVGYSTDGQGNIISPHDGRVLLYGYSRYVEADGTFKLKADEYVKNKDGSLKILAGKRLAFYDTVVQGKTDYSIEFKNMFVLEAGKFYSIPGGFINIPQEYKSKDKDGNIIISTKFFKNFPKFFTEENGNLSTKDFSLKQRVIQPQSAMTIIDNKTGAIKAMIGGRKIMGRMLFNRATSPRQPGSSIKPLAVYSAALQRSYELAKEEKVFPLVKTGYDKQGKAFWGDYITAASIVKDEPMKVNGQLWPKNSYAGYRGIQTFRQALQQSINVCAVKILAQVGIDYSYKLTQKYGITTLVNEGGTNDLNLAALGMGGMSKGVTTLEMASAYTTFVNDGAHKSYYCYRKVTDRNGDVLLKPKKTTTEVLDAGVAWIMRNILQTVVSEGIGNYAAVAGANVGGKTGTTSDSYDIWFDGFTARYSAALWIGNDVNLKLSSMSPAAATLWGRIISQCKKAYRGTYSPMPENVVTANIDLSTGLLSEGKGHSRTEYFTKGTQPTTSGSLYKTVTICTESGYLATPSCTHTEEITGLARPHGDGKDDGETSDELTIPMFYCHLHNPDPAKFPADPTKKVTIVPDPSAQPEDPINDDPDEDDDTPSDDDPPVDEPSDNANPKKS